MSEVLVLVPLDERPVNTSLPAAVAQIGGATLRLPPPSLLPSMRRRPDPDAVAAWVREQAASSDVRALICSVDGLVHGGLIASRTSTDPLAPLLRRLDALTPEPHTDRTAKVTAFGTVTRASDSLVGDEEPAYWPQHGRTLHAWGHIAHRRFEGVAVDPTEDGAVELVPCEIRTDFQTRRLRNHLLDLELLRMRSAGHIAELVITADDTAVHSAGSVEQRWLSHWRELLGLDDVLMYPGGDEVGAVLVARHLARQGPAVRVAADWLDDDGMHRVPPFENREFLAALAMQTQAAGAVLVDTDDAGADARLIVHAPGPDRHDWCASAEPLHDAGLVTAVADRIQSAIASGQPVGVCDVRHTNGGDPRLIAELAERRLITHLSAYAGWNTAGNTAGSAIATLVAATVARRGDHPVREHVERQVLARILEDVCYQSDVRQKLDGRHGVHITREASDRDGAPHFAEDAKNLLTQHLENLGLAARWHIADVELPWRRSFEISLTLQPQSASELVINTARLEYTNPPH